jgi:hypothetical protein
MNPKEIETLLKQMVARAFSDDVRAQLEQDFWVYGKICYRLNSEGVVERIDPGEVYLDATQDPTP